MQKILFVCHGNICRSPMAQYLLAHLAEERGLACRTQSAGHQPGGDRQPHLSPRPAEAAGEGDPLRGPPGGPDDPAGLWGL